MRASLVVLGALEALVAGLALAYAAHEGAWRGLLAYYTLSALAYGLVVGGVAWALGRAGAGGWASLAAGLVVAGVLHSAAILALAGGYDEWRGGPETLALLVESSNVYALAFTRLGGSTLELDPLAYAALDAPTMTVAPGLLLLYRRTRPSRLGPLGVAVEAALAAAVGVKPVEYALILAWAPSLLA